MSRYASYEDEDSWEDAMGACEVVRDLYREGLLRKEVALEVLGALYKYLGTSLNPALDKAFLARIPFKGTKYPAGR